MDERETKLLAKCEEWGPDLVREKITTGGLAGHNAKIARAWLEKYDRGQDELTRAEQSTSTREANELAREANDIAREANEFAQSANTFASHANDLAARSSRQVRTANIIAAAAILVSIITAIATLISQGKAP